MKYHFDPDHHIIGQYPNTKVPKWATPRLRLNWRFVGMILKSDNYETLVAESLRSDHGEEREVDEYPEGAVCYTKE